MKRQALDVRSGGVASLRTMVSLFCIFGLCMFGSYMFSPFVFGPAHSEPSQLPIKNCQLGSEREYLLKLNWTWLTARLRDEPDLSLQALSDELRAHGVFVPDEKTLRCVKSNVMMSIGR
jgi:hypothetical protein